MSDFVAVPVEPVAVTSLEQLLILLSQAPDPVTFNQNLSALENTSPALRELLRGLIDFTGRLGRVGRTSISGQPRLSEPLFLDKGLTLAGFDDQGFLERQVFGG